MIYFYNVYGPRQIKNGPMSTVIGIFEDHYLNKKLYPWVKPGTQTRRFTHVDDTIKVCYEAWVKNRCKYYSISNKKSYSILDVAKCLKVRSNFKSQTRGKICLSFNKISIIIRY